MHYTKHVSKTLVVRDLIQCVTMISVYVLKDLKNQKANVSTKVKQNTNTKTHGIVVNFENKKKNNIILSEASTCYFKKGVNSRE